MAMPSLRASPAKANSPCTRKTERLREIASRLASYPAVAYAVFMDAQGRDLYASLLRSGRTDPQA